MNIEQIETWFVYVCAIALVLSPLVARLRPYALKWIEDSARTKNDIDDKVAKVVLTVIDGFAWLVALAPQVTFGLGQAKRVRDTIKAIEKPRGAR